MAAGANLKRPHEAGVSIWLDTLSRELLRAFADHGEVARTLDGGPAQAVGTLAEAAGAGIDLDAVTAELELEGVGSFCDSYRRLLDCIAGKLGALALTGSRPPS